MFEEYRFDLTQFDPESSDFYLLVDAPYIFNSTIGPITCQIARAVKTRPCSDRGKPCPYE
jgi:hypothetical protein